MKTILITGANQGLGYELALNLKNDFNLILVSRSDHQMKDINSSNDLKITKLDLIPENSVNQFCNELIQNHFLPDIIVHTVGGTLAQDIQPPSFEAIQKTMRLNFTIATQINTLLMPELLKKDQVSLFHVCSDCSLTGNASPAYVSAKSALNGYIQSSARYYAKYGIYFIGFLPGVFEHPNNVWGKRKKEQHPRYQEKLNNYPFDQFFSDKQIADSMSHIIKSTTIAPLNGSLIRLNGGD